VPVNWAAFGGAFLKNAPLFLYGWQLMQTPSRKGLLGRVLNNAESSEVIP
jgi:hypothetical protein